MKLKKILALGLSAIMMAALFAGCGNEEKGNTSALSTTNTLKFAGEVTYPPFEFAENGQFKGFDVDLSHAISKKIGQKVEYVSMGFDALIPALESKQIDAIVSGMTITKERAKKVNFTTPYYIDHLIIVVKKSNNTITGLDSVAGKTIGAQIGTSGSFLAAKQPGTKVKDFNTLTDLLQDVENGGVDGAIINEPVAQYYIQKGGLKDLKIVDLQQPGAEIGIAVNKGNTELLGKINKALKELKADGTIDTLQKKWFGDLH